MTTSPELGDVLQAAMRSGVAHNGGAGGQYLLCATESQLLKFAAVLADRASVADRGVQAVPGEPVATFEQWAKQRGMSPEKLDDANCWIRIAYDEAALAASVAVPGGPSQLAKDFPPMGGLTECDMGDSDE